SSAARAVPAAPPSRKVRPAFVAQAGLIGSAIAIYLLVIGAAGLRHQDSEAYLAAARDIWHGAPLYATFLHHPFPDPTLRPAFIYPPAFALVIAGVLGIVRGGPRYGAALGVAAALKLTPIILLVWLLFDRRLRAAGWMVGAFAAVCGLGALFRFDDTVLFTRQVLPALAPGTAFYANQSLGGVLERVPSANPYIQPWI